MRALVVRVVVVSEAEGLGGNARIVESEGCRPGGGYGASWAPCSGGDFLGARFEPTLVGIAGVGDGEKEPTGMSRPGIGWGKIFGLVDASWWGAGGRGTLCNPKR